MDVGGVTLPEEGTWFCPRHNCISCGALQKSAGSIHNLDLPLQYYLQHRNPNASDDDDEDDDDDDDDECGNLRVSSKPKASKRSLLTMFTHFLLTQ